MPRPLLKNAYALFDFDQTLIPWDSQLLFCNFVLQRQGWRRFYLLFYLPLLPFAKLFGGTEATKRLFLCYLWRVPFDQLEIWADVFAKKLCSQGLYPEMRQVIQEEKARGATLILSSASPALWIEKVGKILGFDHALGTPVHWKQRVELFPQLPQGNNKKEQKITRLDSLIPPMRPLPNSHSYSDSPADIPLLELCEQASIIHPGKKLANYGASRQWQTLKPSRPTRSRLAFGWHCALQALGLFKD